MGDFGGSAGDFDGFVRNMMEVELKSGQFTSEATLTIMHFPERLMAKVVFT